MNSKEEQTNSEDTNLENQSSLENRKNADYSNEKTGDEKLIDVENEYQFGWSSYSEITNGRFAMIGFLAIIIIELVSQRSFLEWAGIL